MVLVDAVLFVELKEPTAQIQQGEEANQFLRAFIAQRLHRTMPSEAARRILAFCGMACKWHGEQCTLAEFCAYVARDVIAHIELAAEARTKPAAARAENAESDAASDSDSEHSPPAIEIEDIGGGSDDEIVVEEEGLPANALSSFPLHDYHRAKALALQQDALQRLHP